MFPTELARLKTDYAKLSDKDQAFALSLLAQVARKGSLSDKQWPWIKTLAGRLDQPAAASADRKLGDLTELKAMFARAGEKIKFPHLLLRLNDTENLKVWIAGGRSKQPGSFSVVPADADKKWAGRIMVDGTWQPSQGRSAEYYNGVADILSELIAAPQATLASHGKQLGACCYCGTELTDERSVQAGYGPTCAKKWGLPWGKAAAR
jgi:hypothetical protein